MKNDFTQTRIPDSYFLKMETHVGSGAFKKMKSMLRSFRQPEKKLPIFSDAVSKGIMDFFEDMGYSANRNI